MTSRDDAQPPRLRGKAIPEDGPSDEAMEAFGRALAEGLRNRWPDFDFIVTRKPRRLAPHRGEPVGGD